MEAWEARYWYACNIILASMGRNLDDWIGEGEAKEKQQLLAIAAEKLKAAVAVKIEAAKVKMQGISQKTRDQLIEEAAARSAVHYSDLFKWANDNTWEATCIVCTAKGFLAGDSVSEEVIEETYDDGPWERVCLLQSAFNQPRRSLGRFTSRLTPIRGAVRAPAISDASTGGAAAVPTWPWAPLYQSVRLVEAPG